MINPRFEVKGLVTQSCPTLYDPMYYSSLRSSVHGILEVRVLEWVAVPFSRGSSGSNLGLLHCRQIPYLGIPRGLQQGHTLWGSDQRHRGETSGRWRAIWWVLCVLLHARVLSHVWLCATPQSGARQAPLSLGFSRQEYWSGLPFHPPGDLPSWGTQPMSPGLPGLAGRFFTTVPPGKPF